MPYPDAGRSRVDISARARIGSFVRTVSSVAARARSDVHARTAEQAEIADQLRQSEKVLEQMFTQVERLLLAIIAVLTSSSPEAIWQRIRPAIQSAGFGRAVQPTDIRRRQYSTTTSARCWNFGSFAE